MIAVSSAADGYVQGQAYNALYATIVGPVLLTLLLMFLSGINLSERPGAKKRYEQGTNWSGYQRYLERTSLLIPFPPALYEKLPVVLKRTVFLEFPLYVFDPAKHADGPPGTSGAQQQAEEGRVGTASKGAHQSSDAYYEGREQSEDGLTGH